MKAVEWSSGRFAEARPGELSLAWVLELNSLSIIAAPCILQPVREAWILLGSSGASAGAIAGNTAADRLIIPRRPSVVVVAGGEALLLGHGDLLNSPSLVASLAVVNGVMLLLAIGNPLQVTI